MEVLQRRLQPGGVGRPGDEPIAVHVAPQLHQHDTPARPGALAPGGTPHCRSPHFLQNTALSTLVRFSESSPCSAGLAPGANAPGSPSDGSAATSPPAGRRSPSLRGTSRRCGPGRFFQPVQVGDDGVQFVDVVLLLRVRQRAALHADRRRPLREAVVHGGEASGERDDSLPQRVADSGARDREWIQNIETQMCLHKAASVPVKAERG